MIKRNGFSWVLFLMLSGLPACSPFSQLIRHADPLTSEQHMQLGASYEGQGLTEPADEQYKAALQKDKKSPSALVARGNLAFGRGDLKKAEACYRQVLRLDPHHVGANNNLAMIYLTSGKDADKAESYAKTALQQGGPLRPYVLETLAAFYVQQVRYPEARKALDEADAAASSDNEALCEQLAKTREKLDSLVLKKGILYEK